jgi:O-antigen ligase
LLSLYLFLLIYIPATLVFAPLGAAGAPSTIYAGMLFVCYLVIWLHPRLTLDRGRQPMRFVAVLFFCTILATYISANRHAMPVLEMNAADRGLIFLSGWLGVLLIAADGINSMDRLRTLLRRLVFGVTVIAMVGVVEFFAGVNAANYVKIPGLTALVQISDLQFRGGFNRPFATASHPIEYGTVLVMVLPLAIHQARFAPQGKRFWRWFQVAVIGFTAPLTVSRSAILGLIVVALVLLPTWPKLDRRIAYVVMLISAVGIWLTVHGLLGTLRNLFLFIGSDSSSTSRTKAYSAAGFYISHHPWFGRGLGTFLPQTYFFIDDQYLTSLIETGIIGLMVLLTLFVTGWITARSARRATADLEARDLAQCLAASVAVAAVSFATFDALTFPMASGLTFLILGCCGACWRLLRGSART